MNFGHKWLQIGGEFSLTLRKFCISLPCHASQTEISKRNSTKLAQRWTLNRANNLPQKTWVVPSEKKLRIKNVYPTYHELWSTNGLKPNRSFTNPHYFVLFKIKKQRANTGL